MITNLILKKYIYLQPDGVKYFIFQALNIWLNIINSLKIQRSMSSGYSDLGTRKLGVVIIAHLLLRETIHKCIN